MQNEAPISSTEEKLKKRLTRERDARKAAEKLLEDKSREVYLANEALKKEIQEREKIQQDLAIAVAEARELTRLKTEFVTNMSHEIRTPLNGIIGLSQLLLDSPLNEEQADYLDEINSSSQLLLDIAEDILDLSNLESDHLTVQNAPIATDEFFKGLRSYAEKSTADRELAVSFDIDSSVPNKLISDEKLLDRIAKCLIENAAKFTEAGSIRISAAAENKSRLVGVLQIEIQDTGCGIPNDQFEHIFKSFSQVDASLTRNHEGTGLGLTISKQLTELLGGEIQVESELGVGSTFTVVVPFEHEKLKADPDFVTPGENCDILLVDENKINQKIASKIFNRIGCELKTAQSGEEALNALRAIQPKVVFLDFQTCQLAAIETAKDIQTEWGENRPHVIGMISDDLDLSKEELHDSGIDSLIQKPMRFESVVSTLQKAKEEKSLA